jgi:hypothetical protein
MGAFHIEFPNRLKLDGGLARELIEHSRGLVEPGDLSEAARWVSDTVDSHRGRVGTCWVADERDPSYSVGPHPGLTLSVPFEIGRIMLGDPYGTES